MSRRNRIVILAIAVAVAATAAAVPTLRSLIMKPRTTVLIEATLADGSKTSFSFPARNLRWPTFEQPVPEPAGDCRLIATIRISMGAERVVPKLTAKPIRVEVGIYGIGHEAWNEYELRLSATGPFLRRLHPPLPPGMQGVPDENPYDWCGVPKRDHLGIQRTRDEKTMVEEAMAFLASLCDQPDLPLEPDMADVREMQRAMEKVLEEGVLDQSAGKSR